MTRALAAIALTVVVTSGLFAATPAAAAVPRAALKGVNVLGWGVSQPRALANDGKHVWVANIGGSSVIELSASTGQMVRVISGASYQFNEPFAITADGTHVWVANMIGNSITELMPPRAPSLERSQRQASHSRVRGRLYLTVPRTGLLTRLAAH